jgi:hypothetical protein
LRNFKGDVHISSPATDRKTWAQCLDMAVKAEDWDLALRLRNEAGTALVGWWVAQSEYDPCGHLLQIFPDFGRYVGIMYKASDLAEWKVRVAR